MSDVSTLKKSVSRRLREMLRYRVTGSKRQSTNFSLCIYAIGPVGCKKLAKANFIFSFCEFYQKYLSLEDDTANDHFSSFYYLLYLWSSIRNNGLWGSARTSNRVDHE